MGIFQFFIWFERAIGKLYFGGEVPCADCELVHSCGHPPRTQCIARIVQINHERKGRYREMFDGM